MVAGLKDEGGESWPGRVGDSQTGVAAGDQWGRFVSHNECAQS